ncbi:hypothetical protein GUJ93_ZPchr0008g12229 [Zizania palustris]|uniref:Uncharacterized protein n=1 Tax=Zizania palustris TaxID=103762 RepID=A0A8J5V576_ZIZPA|nr:hypothetical protein GUJ93_ZPchr0008g12229 [Zizania palustris]
MVQSEQKFVLDQTGHRRGHHGWRASTAGAGLLLPSSPLPSLSPSPEWPAGYRRDWIWCRRGQIQWPRRRPPSRVAGIPLRCGHGLAGPKRAASLLLGHDCGLARPVRCRGPPFRRAAAFAGRIRCPHRRRVPLLRAGRWSPLVPGSRSRLLPPFGGLAAATGASLPMAATTTTESSLGLAITGWSAIPTGWYAATAGALTSCAAAALPTVVPA